VFLRTNVLGTQTLLEGRGASGEALPPHLDRRGVRQPRPEGGSPRSRHSALEPVCGQQGGRRLLVLSYVRTYGIDAVITRCSNNFGPISSRRRSCRCSSPALCERALAPLRRRLERARLDLRGDHCAASTPCYAGARGEVYTSRQQRAREPRPHREILRRMARPRRSSGGRRPPRARLAYALDAAKLRVRWAGRRRTPSREPRRDHRVVSTTKPGGAPSRAESTALLRPLVRKPARAG